MEQPPGTDDLHTPQDLSTSTLPTVLDLTRRGGDQCALVRGNPGWYHNANSSNTGLPLPDATPSTAECGGQIQPDNAFSHTTVTLSYVSRSHVFSTHDSLSGNSSVYGVPTFSKYSLQPPCELGETGVALNQHYLDSVDGDSDLSAQTELFQSLSQAQLELEANTKQTYEFNGEGHLNAESQLDTTEQLNVNGRDFLQNGKNLWLSESLDICAAIPQCPVALNVSETLHEGSNSLCKTSDCSRDHHDFLQSNSTVLPECPQLLQSSESLLESSKSSLEFSQQCLEFLPESSELVPVSSEPIVESRGSSEPLPNNIEALENSLQNSPKSFEVGECENRSPDSQNRDTEDVLDRASPDDVCVSSTPEKTVDRQLEDIISPLEDPMSPSATSLDDIDVFMLPEASSSPNRDNSLLETTDDLSNTQETTQLDFEGGTPDMPLKDVNHGPVRRRKSVQEPLIELTEDDCVSNVLEENLNRTKVLNGKAKVQRRTINERKLPARSSRGMRLEAIVMNINSSRYNVSGCIRSGKKSHQIESKTKLRKSNRLSRNNKKSENKEKPKVSPKKNTSASPENCKRSTSDLALRRSASSLQTSPLQLTRKSSKDQSPRSVNSQQSQMDKCLDVTVGSTSSKAGSSKSPTKNQSKTKNSAPEKKPRTRAKTKNAAKKKRKIFKCGNTSSMFSPKEPEIKLKYVNYKEEKRDSKTDRFKPFVRVQRKEQAPSLCTVVNYPDEVKTPSKRQQLHGASTGYVSTVVPTTSCLRLGRATMQGDQQRALVCCLCGQSANAMDLGDLHGPYYSEGHKPLGKGSKEGSEAKEEGSSDSDLSDSESCGTRRKWTSKKSKQWGSAEGRSPAAKRARPDAEDWYSPPVVPLGPCEYWLHEDCGVWSAGVFLVRGKVYGLEEAVRAAQNMKCSSCGDRGASLGCLFKGCTNKFHYRCALHSDCVLMEDNFSIKCRKHKNKSVTASQSSRRDER